MSELENLVREYKKSRSSMKSKDLALTERNIWSFYLLENRVGYSIPENRNWVRTHLEVTPNDFEMRRNILSRGSWTDPLWDLIDNGTSLRLAISLLREAQVLIKSQDCSDSEALEIAIETHPETGRGSKVKKGTRKTPKPPKSRPAPSQEDIDSTQNNRSKKFQSGVNSLATDFVSASIHSYPEVDETEISKLLGDFHFLVVEACDDLKRKLSQIRSKEKRSVPLQRVSRDSFRRACEVLGISTVFGKAVDLVAAKRVMHRRAGALHPDRNGGSHQSRNEYQSVIESYQVLETYMERLPVKPNGERIHEGR